MNDVTPPSTVEPSPRQRAQWDAGGCGHGACGTPFSLSPHSWYDNGGNEDTFSKINPFSHQTQDDDYLADDRQWESSFRVNILEFTGDLDESKFLDWMATVETVLYYKDVSGNRCVALVTTQLCGRATSWWQQHQAARRQQRKPKKLQNLRQCTWSVNDYTEEFYQILECVDMPAPVAPAPGRPTASCSSTPPVTAGPSAGNRSGGGLRCFLCGELGHRQALCPRSGGSHALFISDGEEHGDNLDYVQKVEHSTFHSSALELGILCYFLFLIIA
ncbi:NAD(P)H-hydrate epimerase [Striga asiatica]|uniref:NAD(P)H-hydrate epimerase n=1 Tax=Striga asiatica TaxID=4170 RepID=A0A5A7RBE5_STRAF|nr:NAD(P)H-hydrate epimerase [Striga asiatica]